MTALTRWGSRDTVLVIVVLGLSLAAGVVAAWNAQIAVLGLVLVSGLVLLAFRPLAIAVLSVPATFMVKRLGPGGAVSYSDVVLAAAAVLALPALAGTPELKRLRPALRALGIYLTALLAGVLVNQSLRADLEWMHRLVLVGGSLVVGAWLVREGGTRIALRLLLAMALFFAVASIVTSLKSGFAPAYPLGFHKNFAGSVLATTLVTLIAAPREFGVPGAVRVPSLIVISLGLLATQSRAALLAAGLGTLIWFFRSLKGRPPRALLLGVVIATGFVSFASWSVVQQLNDKATLNTSSVGVRLQVEARTREIWRTSPIVGVGLKYFNTGAFGPEAVTPNNVIDNELAESGLVGAVGFVLFEGSLIIILFRRREPLALAALAVVTGRLLHGMVDIYWTAGTVTLPFLIAGMALARSQSQTGGELQPKSSATVQPKRFA